MDAARPSPEITIVPAIAEDAAGVAAVQKATWLATYPNQEYGITLQDILSRDWDNPERVARWRKWIGESGDAGRAWVAKHTGGIVGYCFAAKEETCHRVRAVYVLPEYQRQGIGRRLMAAAFEWLGDDRDVAIGVAKYNQQAIAFYQSFGFHPVGDVPPSPSGRLPSGKIIPEIEMVRPRSKS